MKTYGDLNLEKLRESTFKIIDCEESLLTPEKIEAIVAHCKLNHILPVIDEWYFDEENYLEKSSKEGYSLITAKKIREADKKYYLVFSGGAICRFKDYGEKSPTSTGGE